MSRKKHCDLTGKKFNKLSVLSFSHKKERYKENGKLRDSKYYYLCKCDCGKEKIISANNLNRIKGPTKSCGCYRDEMHEKWRKQWDKQISCRNKVFNYYKRRARLIKTNWELDKNFIDNLVKNTCFYCQAEPNNTIKYKNKYTYKYNGIDRKSPKLGYVPNNVVPCCIQCNWSKNKFTVNEFFEWIQKIIKTHPEILK